MDIEDAIKSRNVQVIIAVIIIGFILIFGTTSSRLSILPSFEGINAGVEGFAYKQSYGDVFVRLDTQPSSNPAPGLPGQPSSPYKWISQDPKSAILEGCIGIVIKECGQVRIEVNNPQVVSDPFTINKQIHYWVKVSDNNFVEVEGQIKTYNLGMSVSAVNLPGFDATFKGEKIWLTLTGITWNKALQKAGADYGQAWEAPLAAIITTYNVQDNGDHYKVDPSEVGRWFTLYSTPQQIGTVSDLGLQSNADFNATFTGNTAPDSRLVRSAFFALTLTDFGTTERIVYSNSPVVTYNIKLYTIQIGKYTYTNPDETPFKEREPEGVDPFKGIKDWFSNPFNLAGLGIFGIVAIGAVTVIAMFWIFGLPRMRRDT